MTLVDTLILVLAIIMFLAGWRSGFVRSAGSLVALAVSIGVSFYGMTWLHDTFGFSYTANPWSTVSAFLVLSLVANRLAHYFVDILDLVRKVIAIIPFVNTINSLLGALLGLAQTAVLVLVLAYVGVRLVPAGDIRTKILESQAVGQAVNVESGAGIL